jgi:hypothetical protein
MATTNDRRSTKIRRRGRPSKLRMLLRSEPDSYERMLTLIRAGAFVWVAAQSLGITVVAECQATRLLLAYTNDHTQSAASPKNTTGAVS